MWRWRLQLHAYRAISVPLRTSFCSHPLNSKIVPVHCPVWLLLLLCRQCCRRFCCSISRSASIVSSLACKSDQLQSSRQKCIHDLQWVCQHTRNELNPTEHSSATHRLAHTQLSERVFLPLLLLQLSPATRINASDNAISTSGAFVPRAFAQHRFIVGQHRWVKEVEQQQRHSISVGRYKYFELESFEVFFNNAKWCSGEQIDRWHVTKWKRNEAKMGWHGCN